MKLIVFLIIAILVLLLIIRIVDKAVLETCGISLGEMLWDRWTRFDKDDPEDPRC